MQWKDDKKKLLKIIDSTLKSGQWVGGNEVNLFEKKIENLLSINNCISLNSGTDALVLALHACGISRGDEVITPPNSFIASTSAIVHLGAKPVFVDVKEDQNIDENLIENYISKKTKAIMPVHLTGRMCEMDKINKLAKKYKLKVIEDSAQAYAAKNNNKFAGTCGDFGCFSTHPLKNLNSFGDGGFIVSKNKILSKYITDLKSHGMSFNRNIIKHFGYVSRMDNIQASILNFKLSKIDQIINTRRKNYSIYSKLLNSNNIYFPKEERHQFNTYHTFVIQIDKRDKIINYLKHKGIETSIHYPVPIHLQPAAKRLGYKKGSFIKTEDQAKRILSLPIHQNLSKNDIEFIANSVNNFFKT